MSAKAIAEMVDQNEYIAKVIPIQIRRDSRGVTRELPPDPFENLYAEGIIEPPYDLFTLAVMPEVSSELGPAIDAMVVNIAKMGYRIIPRENLPYDEEELDIRVKQERAKVKNFFANAVLEPTETFTSFRATMRHDLETTGNSYFEVLPNLMTGEPAGLNHLPSWQMRLRKEDDEMTDHIVMRAVEGDGGQWYIHEFPYTKRFRRFVQIRDAATEKVFFKEWGDPRAIDKRDGHVFTDTELNSADFNPENLATEVVHVKLYCPRSPYGLPRWIGNLFTIFGTRAAEVINYTTFRNNNIPAMILMATNIQLTDASIERIQKFVEERIQGDDNYSTILLVEAEPVTEGMKDPGNMKLEIKELTQAQHTDALFVKYMERGDDKIRRSFRLAPLMMGRSEDYTRSTADASRKVTEEQVFRPERNEDDIVWNQTILPMLGAANVVFKSNTPDVTDNYELTQLLAVAEQSGGLSPVISRMIVEDVLGKDLPPIDPSIPGNIPFSLTILRESIDAQLEEAGVSSEEATEQLEKLKILMDGNEDIPEDARKSVDLILKLLKIRSKSKAKTKKPSKESANEVVVIPRVSENEEDEEEEDEEKAGCKDDDDEKKGTGCKDDEEDRRKTIREVDGQYCVFSEDGSHNFGCYNTMSEAKDRLAQVERFSEKRIDIRHVFKAESEQHIVGGAVLVPGVVDLQGDIYNADVVEAAAHYWLEHYMDDPKENGIKIMHKGEVISDAARPIQSWVLDRDMEFNVEVPAASDEHPAKELSTLSYPKGTWMMYARIRDDELWGMFKNGELSGWSIGGLATVQHLKYFLNSHTGNNTDR